MKLGIQIQKECFVTICWVRDIYFWRMVHVLLQLYGESGRGLACIASLGGLSPSITIPLKKDGLWLVTNDGRQRKSPRAMPLCRIQLPGILHNFCDFLAGKVNFNGICVSFPSFFLSNITHIKGKVCSRDH